MPISPLRAYRVSGGIAMSTLRAAFERLKAGATVR
jgi:hypothetical protein